ncbi:MAG: TonB-dependent receptor [Xanthomonadaceae bacterium]|nr:TonB-dependent receptor [Xanthomonadaceae bacterium]
MNFKRNSLALAIAVSAIAPQANAQNTPASAAAATALDTVIVTGTRVSNRTVAESSSPIDIITPDALEATGTTELATALARALPSLNFPRPALTDGTGSIRPAQLRGLSPDQVLVLVNGKRRHTSSLLNLNGTVGRGSAPVDLNTIPVAAIARVEVLRDGASAQYGSDAIAGVINIVLKGAEQGGSLETGYGQYSAGDGKNYQISGDTGLDLAAGRGFLHLAAQLNQQDNTNRARPYAGAPDPTQPRVGQKAQIIGDPQVDFGAVSANAEFSINDALTAYAFGMASNRDSTAYAFSRAAGNANNILSIYPDGFVPEINSYTKDRSLIAGLRGAFGRWDWDLSYNYGYNRIDLYTRNTLNASLGPDSPTAFYDGALETTQNIANLDLSTSFDWGLAAPAVFSFGGEFRNEKWNQSPGNPDSYIKGIYSGGAGAQGFGGFSPNNAGHYSRDSYAFYADLETSFSDKFSTGLAARYEHFDDFGSQWSGKFSARYAFNDAIALRGTVATGFRAPSLAQQYYQSVTTTFLPGNPIPQEAGLFPANGTVAQALGSEKLKAEESLSYSLGLVLQPVENLYVTLDAYQIEVDDRIVLSSNMNNGVQSFLENRGIYGVTTARYFTNAVDTRTRGVDLVGTYRLDLANSTLNLTTGYNYTKTEIIHVAANPAELESNGLQLERIDRIERGRIERSFPRDKFLINGVWDLQNWSLALGAARYGQFVERSSLGPQQDKTYAARWVADASATYRVDGWSFTLGADNLFDAYPEKSLFSNSNSGQRIYSNLSPFGFNGAYVYARIGYRW